MVEQNRQGREQNAKYAHRLVSAIQAGDSSEFSNVINDAIQTHVPGSSEDDRDQAGKDGTVDESAGLSSDTESPADE